MTRVGLRPVVEIKYVRGWEMGLMLEYLLRMDDALGSIFTTGKINLKKHTRGHIDVGVNGGRAV